MMAALNSTNRFVLDYRHLIKLAPEVCNAYREITLEGIGCSGVGVVETIVG